MKSINDLKSIRNLLFNLMIVLLTIVVFVDNISFGYYLNYPFKLLFGMSSYLVWGFVSINSIFAVVLKKMNNKKRHTFFFGMFVLLLSLISLFSLNYVSSLEPQVVFNGLFDKIISSFKEANELSVIDFKFNNGELNSGLIGYGLGSLVYAIVKDKVASILALVLVGFIGFSISLLTISVKKRDKNAPVETKQKKKIKNPEFIREISTQKEGIVEEKNENPIREIENNERNEYIQFGVDTVESNPIGFKDVLYKGHEKIEYSRIVEIPAQNNIMNDIVEDKPVEESANITEVVNFNDIVDIANTKIEEKKKEEVPADSFDIFNDEIFSKKDQVLTDSKSSNVSDFNVFSDSIVNEKIEVNEEQKQVQDEIVIGDTEESTAVEPIVKEEKPVYDSFKQNSSVFYEKEEEEEVVEEQPVQNPHHYMTYDEEEPPKQEVQYESFSVHHEIEQKPLEKQTDKVVYNYKLPSLNLLKDTVYTDTSENTVEAEMNAIKLNAKLKSLGINGKVVGFTVAPAFTRFEIQVESDVKINQIPNCKNDIQMALAATKINILAPIPGTPYVGVDVPNIKRSSVGFKECFGGIPYGLIDNKLVAVLGKDITGKVVSIELNEAPHLLVAGSTGSGKSVCLNTIICSLIMRARPDEVGLLLIDPKKVELNAYSNIPHLICPTITDNKKASVALKRLCEEMDRRYDIFHDSAVKDIKGYNRKMKATGGEPLKYIVVVIDEFADLILGDKGGVEESIRRLTQLARTAGIHLVVATQRPSVDVITGVIKGNIASRIVFAVSSNLDSRVVIDEGGGEELLGKGDMLVRYSGIIGLQRVQGCWISDEEIENVCTYLSNSSVPTFDQNFLDLEEKQPEQLRFEEMTNIDKSADDEVYEEILRFLHGTPIISVSMLRRRFILGQPRAARMIDRLEADGFIGPQENNKPRTVYQNCLPDLEDKNEENPY